MELHTNLAKRTEKIWGELAELHPRLVRFDPPLIFLNSRLWRVAGRCDQNFRTIEIGLKFYRAGFATRMNRVILPHEIIHQADFDLFGCSDLPCGHGRNWRMLMIQYGLEPEPFHTMNLTRHGKKVV